MASVLLASDSGIRSWNVDLAHERVVPLRQWLNGDWGIVLSDPQDFAPHPSTPSGFVNRLADSVLTARVKLIAFGRSLEPTPSWLDHAVNDDSVVVLDSNGRIIDLAERALASRLATLERPFALILDDNAQCRTTLQYLQQPAERSTCRMSDLIEIVTRLRSG